MVLKVRLPQPTSLQVCTNGLQNRDGLLKHQSLNPNCARRIGHWLKSFTASRLSWRLREKQCSICRRELFSSKARRKSRSKTLRRATQLLDTASGLRSEAKKVLPAQHKEAGMHSRRMLKCLVPPLSQMNSGSHPVDSLVSTSTSTCSRQYQNRHILFQMWMMFRISHRTSSHKPIRQDSAGFLLGSPASGQQIPPLCITMP